MKENMRRPVSAVLIAFNEGGRIGPCLESLRFADEIVVVDSGSVDDTVEIARRFTDNVFRVPWKGFGPQKQAAVALATHDIVLNVDCDERVTPELAEEIAILMEKPEFHAGYTVPRRTFLGDKEIRHCGWYPDRTVRLFDRSRARYSDAAGHERVVVDGPIGRLENHLLHYSFRGITDILRKTDHYADLSARTMFAEGRRCCFSDLTVRPFLAVMKTYILRLGILDGVEGLEIAIAAGLYVFAKYARLRELEMDSEVGSS
jgi:glycosyltransferase involved in cell wall biosynthesis